LQPKVEAWFEDGMLRYYVCLGTPEEVLKSYTQLTGRAPLPPRWALGYHQCRWGYRTEADIRRVAQGFQEHDLPISAIHLDIDYMDGFRVFTVNQERFPDLAGLARDLACQGIRLVTILDPGVKRDPGYFLYREGLRRKVFCKTFFGRPLIGLVWPDWSAFPDFTNPEARKWWGEQYPRLLDQGVAGFWHDMNEPTSFAAWGDTTLPLPTRHSLEGRGGDHRQAHNLYALQMNRAGFEALRRQRPDRRPWILSRAGWAGQQRYAWNWTGDIETSWESLRMTLPTVLGLGLSGLPFSGPDVGGFSGDPSAELYLRWFQMACFFPFFRTHSALGTAPREPWVFGEETTRRVREALRLRYSLIPYLYTLAWEASQTGCPPVRPLFWADPGDRRLWQVEDAFLFGSALLVAPILEEGAQDRQVSLPGGEWFDFWSDARIEGGDSVRLQASLDHIPLLARAGSLLPLEVNGRLQLHLYAPSEGEGEGRLYLDAGDGYGEWRLERYRLRRSDGRLEIERESQGPYAFPYPAVELVIHGFSAGGAWVDGQPAPCENNRLICPSFQQIFIER
jgi:alpha-glucosidase